jgi:selenocysteine lyase/cysteine desulfurase
LFLALGAALDFVQQVGFDEIEAHVKLLAQNLKTRLTQIPGVCMQSDGNHAEHWFGLI